jgi:hypothetical protein
VVRSRSQSTTRYTTTPEEGRSTRYCTDIAKTFGAPVFHINAEDPESCIWVARLAIEIRQKFHCDVFINLNGYRKYGHNETDEPGFTQPLEYAQIRARKTVRQNYVEQYGLQEVALAIETAFREELKRESLPKSDLGAIGPILHNLMRLLFFSPSLRALKQKICNDWWPFSVVFRKDFISTPS